jgi:hypothetical protein
MPRYELGGDGKYFVRIHRDIRRLLTDRFWALLYPAKRHTVPPHGALAWYERALFVDPSHGWASLYRAHCLHDLERWAEAADTYSAVDPSFLVGPRAGRYEHLLESRAFCRWRAGETGRAQAEFEELLDRWERNPHLANDAWGHYLAEAATGPLRPLLYERTWVLFRREDDARALDQRGLGASPGLSVSMLTGPELLPPLQK